MENYPWQGPTKLDNRLFQNVQYIQLSHKVYWEYHEKLENGTESKSKKLSWGKNPERNFSGRCAIAIIICNSNDTTQSNT